MKKLVFMIVAISAMYLGVNGQTIALNTKPPMRKEFPQTKEGSVEYQAELKKYNEIWVKKQKTQFKASEKSHRQLVGKEVKNGSNVKGVKGCTRDSNGLPQKRR